MTDEKKATLDEFVGLIVNLSMCGVLGNTRDAVREGYKALSVLEELYMYGPVEDADFKSIHHKLKQMVISCGGMVRSLTREEVTAYAERPDVRKVAVVNFLSSMPGDVTHEDTLANLIADARSHGWNTETYRAIREGIHKAYGRDGLW